MIFKENEREHLQTNIFLPKKNKGQPSKKNLTVGLQSELPIIFFTP